MSRIFSIVTKCDSRDDLKFFAECFDSIRQFYPDDEIVIVDSDSKLTLHYEHFRSLKNVHVLEIKNKNYETGAIWSVYEKFDRDTYIFMQDSMRIVSSLDTFFGNEIVYFSDYYGWHDPTDVEHLWAQEKMKLCDYGYIKKDYDYKMLQFNSMICKRTVLDKLKSKKLDLILPTNKNESQAMERVFGMALHHEGYDVDFKNLTSEQIHKEFRKRQ